METYREIYDKGFDYYHNTVSLQKSNRFGESVTVHIALLAAEYLLTSVVVKNGILLYGHGMHEIVKALTFHRLIPSSMAEKAESLSQGCGCEVTVTPTAAEVNEKVEVLRQLKLWTDKQIKETVQA